MPRKPKGEEKEIERAVEKSGAEAVGVFIDANGTETFVREYSAAAHGANFIRMAEGFAEKQTKKPGMKKHYVKKTR